MSASATERAYARWQDLYDVNTHLISAFEQYQRAQGLAPRTVANRSAILRPLARFHGAKLLALETGELRAYLARQGVMQSSKRIERAAMVAFYAFAVEDGYLSASPAARLAPVRVPRGTPRPFTREQISAMLTSGAYLRTRAMILLGYAQGFRVSQIARVRGDDIDLSAGSIRTVAKGSKEARLPLAPVVAAVAPLMPAAGWWFPSPYRPGPIRSESVTDAITEAKRRAGITDPRLTPHSLRHSFGSELVEHGVDIRVVQELMLHDDISTTQIYTRVSEQRKRDGIAAIPTLSIPISSGREGKLCA